MTGTRCSTASGAGDDARGMPGSGLGMAIVADAAESHGGTARVGEAPGGGAAVVLSLPGHRPAEAPKHGEQHNATG